MHASRQDKEVAREPDAEVVFWITGLYRGRSVRSYASAVIPSSPLTVICFRALTIES
jgi:hypothetical protein